MHLRPAITQDEAYQWLKQQAEQLMGAKPPPADLESTLRQFAEAMAEISVVVLPDSVEPRFP